MGNPVKTWRVSFSGDSERQIKKCSVNRVSFCAFSSEENLEPDFLLRALKDM